MSTTDVPAPAQQQGPSGGVKCTTAFRCHDNNSKESCDHDDNYRTVTLHTDGAFTDYYEHLWDLKSNWVTEGVDVVVYGGTYTLDGSQVQLRYTKIVSKVTDVVLAREKLEADEPLEEPVSASGTLSAGGTSLAVKPFGKSDSEPQVLAARRTPFLPCGGGGKYS